MTRRDMIYVYAVNVESIAFIHLHQHLPPTGTHGVLVWVGGGT